MLSFVAIGLDHTTSPIDLRERVAFTDAEIPAVLQRLTAAADPLLDQAAILSTCNRIELYGVARSPPAERRLASVLARNGVERPEIENTLYIYRDDRVAHRLAETAAGIHSAIVGEAQIQGQVRKALEHALAADTAGTELRRLFEAAISAGRRVRAQTAIGRGVASIPGASVSYAHRRFGTLTPCAALVVGTGQTSELALKHLAQHRVARLLVHSRSPGRGSRLAARYGAQAISTDSLDDALAIADLVISATGAPRPTLRLQRLERALADRGPRRMPLLVIDLSVPRDVDPAAAGLRGLELLTVDDIGDITARAVVQRRTELPHAYAVAGAEAARFASWLHRREAARLGATPYP